MLNPNQSCPCRSNLRYADCCGRYHAGETTPATAEALKRSRYSAFVVGDEAYIRSTWAEETLPADLSINPDGEPYTNLEILGTSGGGPFDKDGAVTFAATHASGIQCEYSTFERRAGRWVYVRGLPAPPAGFIPR